MTIKRESFKAINLTDDNSAHEEAKTLINKHAEIINGMAAPSFLLAYTDANNNGTDKAQGTAIGAGTREDIAELVENVVNMHGVAITTIDGVFDDLCPEEVFLAGAMDIMLTYMMDRIQDGQAEQVKKFLDDLPLIVKETIDMCEEKLTPSSPSSESIH
jgi:hypothetical protein